MSAPLKLHYEVDGNDFTMAGAASSDVKKLLKRIGLPPELVRRVSVCMYEGEINMIIHAGGGVADVELDTVRVRIQLTDQGPGIPDVGLAMQEGYSTADENVRNLGFGAGMGLPNMKKNSDTLEIDTAPGRGTTVVMEIGIQR